MWKCQVLVRQTLILLKKSCFLYGLRKSKKSDAQGSGGDIFIEREVGGDGGAASAGGVGGGGGRGDGVVLNSGGRSIVTGLSSEEILEQLNLDYQDVYDYYGGAEELW